MISTPVRAEPSLLDKIIGIATNTWVLIIAGAVLLAGAVLFWFVRRGRDEDDEEWTSAGMSAPDLDDTALSSTEALRAPSRDDESIVVVEQGSTGIGSLDEDTLDAPGPGPGGGGQTVEMGALASMEDTFSSDTAVNLDQSDPIAEADFHMAYGLYDQAADLINGALEAEPDRLDLLTKLCEIYFVWGNRDAFVDAAARVKQAAGDDDGGEWNKIVIMGQQIAADDAMFAGAGLPVLRRPWTSPSTPTTTRAALSTWISAQATRAATKSSTSVGTVRTTMSSTSRLATIPRRRSST